MGATGTAVSTDGTEIAIRTTGSGAGVVIVPGSLFDGSDWSAVADLLAPYFTVHIMSRRGTGLSGDNAQYSIEREYDDIHAVLASTGSTRLVAHSFGAVCALGAALRTSALERLVLYEPPVNVDAAVVPDNALAEVERATDRGDIATVIEVGLTRCVRMPPELVADLKRSRMWSDMERDGRHWARELRAIHDLPDGVDRYAGITVPTLLLFGESTQSHHRAAIDALALVLPHAKVTPLRAAGHEAQLLAPYETAQALLEFLP